MAKQFGEEIIPAAQAPIKARELARASSYGHKGKSPQEAGRQQDIRELRAMVRNFGQEYVENYLAELSRRGNARSNPITMEEIL